MSDMEFKLQMSTFVGKVEQYIENQNLLNAKYDKKFNEIDTEVKKINFTLIKVMTLLTCGSALITVGWQIIKALKLI